MVDVRIAGCQPAPLGHYLMALALLRLVAEQVDASTEGWWEGDRFMLRSPLDGDGLVDFLCDRYRPSPLLAPWNGGSGFGPKDATSSPTAVAAVARVADSADPRLMPYRRTIDVARRLAARDDWATLAKEQQVALCRNELPDEALAWIDATVVLTADGGRAFPVLLGTGGNDGRLDFSSNFLQRIAEVLGVVARPKRTSSIRDLARTALFEDGSVRLDRGAIGQFDPGGAGGVGSSPVGGDALANPWELVLSLEGALVFASAAARRLSTGRAAVAVPFMFATSPTGHPSASSEKSRGELWAPLWRRPATAAEIGRLVSEGRAELGHRQARNGLDVARAVASLGVDRGIDEFQRHAFLERNGLATFAIPVGRVQVRERAGVQLLGQLDGWTSRLRGVKNAPGALGPALRALDEAQFVVATTRDQGSALQRVLVALADVEHLVLRSRALAKVGPVHGLQGQPWLQAMEDSSDELAVAAAVASLRRKSGSASKLSHYGALRSLFVDLDGQAAPPAVPGVEHRPLVTLLADAHVRLAIEHPPSSTGGVRDRPRRWLGDLDARRTVGGRALSAFLVGGLDERRVRQLLRACLLLDWSRVSWVGRDRSDLGVVPAVFSVVGPAFHHRTFSDGAELPVAAAWWPRQLLIGQVEAVVADGLKRLRISSFTPLVRDPRSLAVGVDGPRLAAAGLLPLTDRTVHDLVRRVARDPNTEAKTGKADAAPDPASHDHENVRQEVS